jgi:hypothetical protein
MECAAVQFAPALPILADSRVHGSHEGDPNLRGVLSMRPDVPALLSPDQRSREIACLLAAGVRRLFSRPANDIPGPHPEPEKSQESSETGLEVGSETRLSVHTG